MNPTLRTSRLPELRRPRPGQRGERLPRRMAGCAA